MQFLKKSWHLRWVKTMVIWWMAHSTTDNFFGIRKPACRHAVKPVRFTRMFIHVALDHGGSKLAGIILITIYGMNLRQFQSNIGLWALSIDKSTLILTENHFLLTWQHQSLTKQWQTSKTYLHINRPKWVKWFILYTFHLQGYHKNNVHMKLTGTQARQQLFYLLLMLQMIF